MKKIFLFLILTVPFIINAQVSWNLVVDNSDYNVSHVTDACLFQDSIVLVSGFVSDVSCQRHKLFAYNIDGKLLWEKSGFYDLICADDDCVYTAGYTPVDDVLGIQQVIIAKYDKYGNEIMNIGFPDIPNEQFFEFKPQNMELVSDGNLLLCSDKSIVKINTLSGKIKEYFVATELPIKAIHVISSMSYLVNTSNKIYKTDSSIYFKDSVQFTKAINDIYEDNDTVIVVFDSMLVKLDTNLNIQDTLIDDGGKYLSLYKYDNLLWMQSETSDSVVLINVQDDNQNRKVFPKLVNDVNVLKTSKYYVFVGNTYSNQIGMYAYHHSDDYKSSNLSDIELVDFNIDSITLDYRNYQGAPVAIGYYFNLELVVRNKGNDTIYGFSVFSALHGGENCARNYTYKKFTDISILPGQSLNLGYGRVYEDGITNNQLCFQCLAPNSTIETAVSDNVVCKTFDITSIEDPLIVKTKVYPNPFVDALIVENADMQIKTIQIIDLNGKILIDRAVVAPKLNIDTDCLPSGLYLIRVISNLKTENKLIMKQKV